MIEPTTYPKLTDLESAPKIAQELLDYPSYLAGRTDVGNYKRALELLVKMGAA